jgi:hypothetical protein
MFIISFDTPVPRVLLNFVNNVNRIISMREDFPWLFGAIIPIGD